MKIQTKQFVVDLNFKYKAKKRPNFFDLAKKNIVKSKKGVKTNLSQQIDKILYGS